MQYFDRSQVMELLDMAGCIGLMRDTLIDYSTGQTIQVLRTAMPLAPGKVLGVIPAGNTHRGITGALKTILDADSITGIRTAAVSSAATDALARKDAHVLCVLGSGLQARRHVEAMCLIRKIDEIRVWDISRESVKRFKAEMEETYGVPVHDCCDDVQKAVAKSRFFCDSRESCMNEAGDLLIPIRNGELTEDHLLGEVGLVFNGTLSFRNASFEA